MVLDLICKACINSAINSAVQGSNDRADARAASKMEQAYAMHPELQQIVGRIGGMNKMEHMELFSYCEDICNSKNPANCNFIQLGLSGRNDMHIPITPDMQLSSDDIVVCLKAMALGGGLFMTASQMLQVFGPKLESRDMVKVLFAAALVDNEKFFQMAISLPQHTYKDQCCFGGSSNLKKCRKITQSPNIHLMIEQKVAGELHKNQQQQQQQMDPNMQQQQGQMMPGAVGGTAPVQQQQPGQGQAGQQQADQPAVPAVAAAAQADRQQQS